MVDRVRFKTVGVKALVNQLSGQEPAYPVWRLGASVKFERPEVPGQTYRRHRV